MLKGAFFFGGRGEAPYPEVTKIVKEGGLNYVMWGKEVRPALRRRIKTFARRLIITKTNLTLANLRKSDKIILMIFLLLWSPEI